MLLWLSDYVLDVANNELASLGITESKLDFLLLLTLHKVKRATPSAATFVSALMIQSKNVGLNCSEELESFRLNGKK